MDKIEELYQYLPQDNINWDLIKKTLLKPFIMDLEKTNQEEKWHGEGNVLIHSIMVVEELIKLKEYQLLTKKEQLILFLASLFHDVGKPSTTKLIDGEIRSLHHGPKGALMIRNYLWTQYDLAGTIEYQSFREAICLLIKYHSVPTFYQKDVLKTVIKLSLNQKLTPLFSNKLLTILAKADVLGRIGNEKEIHLANITKYSNLAIENNCYDQAFAFSDGYTKYQYIKQENMWPYQSLYNQNYGNVYLICGLPGTGKDYYINNCLKGLPIISLDEIRKEYKIKPTDNQKRVGMIAHEKMKEYLRAKKSFVFNATNLTKMIRDKQINIMHDYHASVEIIFLETSMEANLKRNQARKKVVEEKIIAKLLDALEIPEAYEAEMVKWICL